MIGDRWYVWGKHWTVVEERCLGPSHEVRLVPDGAEPKQHKKYPFVELRRVELHGRPSQA